MRSLKNLIREIHRRSIWQVLSIYLVSGWIVYQIVLDLVEGLGLPDWFPPFAVVLLLLGLPMVLATAVVQERPGEPLDHTAEGAPDPVEDAGAGERLLTWRNTILGGMAALALWGVFAAGWVLFGGTTTALVPPSGPAVAVLPFTTIGNDPENEYFSEGIHEDIIAQLSRIDGLKVISRTSVMRYAGAEALDLREIARTLDVSAILEGSVRRDSPRVRIVAQLIDGQSEGHLWAETYDRRLDDVFAIQSEVARRIADALAVTLSPEDQRRVEERPTDHPGAYEEYLKGRHHWNRRTADGLEAAIRHFNRALELDSAYAQAYAGLADAYLLLPYYAGRPPGDSRDEIQDAAERALALDPRLAEPHATLGLLYTDWDRNLAAGEEEYRRAIRLNPNYATAWQWLALNRWFQDRPEDALEASMQAGELDPLAPIIPENRMYYYLALGQPEQAYALGQEILALDPGFRAAHDNIALALLILGRPYEALEAVSDLDPLGTTTTAVIHGHILQALDDTAGIADVYAALRARAGTQFVSPTALAALAELLGRESDAVRHRERASRVQDPWRNYVTGILELIDTGDAD
ncbi:MAG: hypothetical protein R3314_01945 [Longimicrobiales bacterium]|nr:hypothetical protein [Longimicrobiales bacterium]